MILTPDGTGVEIFVWREIFAQRNLSGALREAGADKDRFADRTSSFLLCFHYSPITGKYGPLIMSDAFGHPAVVTLVILGRMLIGSPRHSLTSANAKRKERRAP